MDSAPWWTVRAPENNDNKGAESFDLDESKQKKPRIWQGNIKALSREKKHQSKKSWILKKSMNIKKTTYQFIVARKSLHVFVRESNVSFFKRYCLGFHIISVVLWRVSKAAVRWSKSQSSEWLSDQRVFDLSFCLGQVEPPHLFRSQTVNISGGEKQLWDTWHYWALLIWCARPQSSGITGLQL